ncbi:MAG: hypothetical protein JO019_00600 [Candidatus Kaiserbacteria bacterium]|nr:hypothetical protein [Candidatus Kaiserbacteria bacterium]
MERFSSRIEPEEPGRKMHGVDAQLAGSKEKAKPVARQLAELELSIAILRATGSETESKKLAEMEEQADFMRGSLQKSAKAADALEDYRERLLGQLAPKNRLQ